MMDYKYHSLSPHRAFPRPAAPISSNTSSTQLSRTPDFTMAPRIFVTGISGYIGGQLLHDITKKHPEYHVRGLVRTAEQQEKVFSKYPSVGTVIGDLDSAEILKVEAAQADVILRTYCLPPFPQQEQD
jgi:nucleoside-diphosphate-sugar epimerase